MLQNESTLLFDGIPLCMSSTILEKFPIKYTYQTFPDSFCGAGDGIWEKLVPDYIFGLTRLFKIIRLDISIKISPACWIHDKEWIAASPEWSAFYGSNSRFHRNIESIITTKCSNELIRARALYRPVTYLNAVDLHGKRIFWTLKSAQAMTIPKDALQYVDYHAVETLQLKERSGELTL